MKDWISSCSVYQGGKWMKENVTTENREYKSDVFSMLMQVPEYALNVYNALNGSNYDDPGLVEMKTLDKCVSLTVRNDAAFIIDMNLCIYEHQSSYNPNMPLRVLLYLADILKPLLKQKDIYSRSKILIPKPNFVVFYNGIENRPQKEIQKLSDLYQHDEEINLELICTVYNINPGYNEEIKQKSEVLEGYTVFVEKVREYFTDEDENAVSRAVDYCIEHNILVDFFSSRKEEVVKNMTLDMTFERRLELAAIEYKNQGIQQGIELETERGIKSIVDTVKMLGSAKEKAVEIIMKNYNKNEIEAKELVDKYW